MQLSITAVEHLLIFVLCTNGSSLHLFLGLIKLYLCTENRGEKSSLAKVHHYNIDALEKICHIPTLKSIHYADLIKTKLNVST